MADDPRPSARADLVGAAVWIVLGAAIVIGSWRMDRLESQGATLYTMPGTVPGLLGAIIALFGLALARRAIAAGARPADAGAREPGGAQFGTALALCLVYAVGLVGHAPFWLATFLFVAAFVALFEYPMRKARGQIARGLLLAAIYGTGTSAVVSYVFEQLFLVRLP